jgi:hypothetical protein
MHTRTRLKAATVLQCLFGSLVAAGAAGHSFVSGPGVQQALAGTVPTATGLLVMTVWHFAGACMVLLGLCAVIEALLWDQARFTGLVGAFYSAFGAITLLATGQRFFAVFVVLGCGLLTAAWLRRSASAEPSARS